MGDDVTAIESLQPLPAPGAIPRWLDAETCALVADVTATLADHYPDLLAVILYGSIARHDERPLDAHHPRDVDLLAVFATDDELLTAHRGLDISQTLNPAYQRHLNAPREVQVMLASDGMREWDPTFVANVVRDGVLLYGTCTHPIAIA